MDRNTTSYRYAADGRKLRATYKTFPGQHVGDDDRYTERNDSGLVRPGNGRIFVPSTFVETKTVDYVGNLIYEDNVIKKILIDGGYITFNEGNAPEYHFYIKDHLGNNRVVVHTSGEVEQVNHYYPYGGLMAESTNWNTQWYKYNGKARACESRESMYALLCRVQPRLDTVKELDRMHGLDRYDYGARWQDAAIGGRWHAMDPLCEMYYDVSPYVYCMNNPVRFVDPDGRDNYSLNRDGTLELLQRTVSKTTDKIVAGNQSMLVGKNITKQLLQERDDYDGSYAVGTKNMDKLFKFLADNTDVEWSLEKYDTNKGQKFVLATSHKESVRTKTNDGQQIGGFYELDLTLRIHSHFGDSPQVASGYTDNSIQKGTLYSVGGDDQYTINETYNKFKNANKQYPTQDPKFYIYHVKTQTRIGYTPLKNRISVTRVNNFADLLK